MRIATRIASLAAVTVFTTPGFARNSLAPQSEEERVLAAEDKYVTAELAGEEAALRRLVDDRFVFNSAKGTTMGKDDWVQAVLHSAMVSHVVSERSVLLEDDVTLVFGTTELEYAPPGKPQYTSVLRYTATYVRREGEWRMLALQMLRRGGRVAFGTRLLNLQ